MRVMTVLATVFGVKDPEVLCAAALHDTIEDTTADYDDLAKEFSPRVAGWVGELSKDKRLPEEIREKAYFAGLARASIEVKLCKMGDTYDNLKDSATLEAKGRFKAVAKARELVGLFEKGWPAEWKVVMEKVKAVIEEAEKRTDN
jgi:guanosine-3',5'-bis(diphosphate) 3'-pyrophosphohydrolase